MTAELKDEEKKNVFFLFNYSDTALVTSGKNFWGQYRCVNAIECSKCQARKLRQSARMRSVNTCGAGLQLECRKSSSSAISQRQCREDLYNNTIGDNDWSSVSAVKNEQV